MHLGHGKFSPLDVMTAEHILTLGLPFGASWFGMASICSKLLNVDGKFMDTPIVKA